MNLSGTKEIIFDTALRLFSTFGFEEVNMREIASECKIKSSSIYNHYISKQEILNTIYAYYKECFFDNLASDGDIKQVIATGTKEQILNTIVFTFESADVKKYYRMIWTSKLVYMRIFKDEKAKEIYFSLMTAEPQAYVQKYMEYGISIGRFAPFDTKTYAELVVGCRHGMALSAFTAKDYAAGQLEEEYRLNRLLQELLPIIDNK